MHRKQAREPQETSTEKARPGLGIHDITVGRTYRFTSVEGKVTVARALRFVRAKDWFFPTEKAGIEDEIDFVELEDAQGKHYLCPVVDNDMEALEQNPR